MMKSRAQTMLVSNKRAHRVVGYSIVALLRIMAIVMLGLAILVWLRAVGFWDGASMRFDTMSKPEKILTAMLAVLFPIASVGLWSTLSWGRVVWYAAVLVQVAGALFYSASLFPSAVMIAFHGAAIAIYLILRLRMDAMLKED